MPPSHAPRKNPSFAAKWETQWQPLVDQSSKRTLQQARTLLDKPSGRKAAMTELTAGRACPTLRTLLGDCTLASSNSTVYCATFDEDESDDSDEVADNEASESDDSASCWAVEEVAVADLAGLEIQAVDLSTVDGANLNQL